MFDGWLQIQCVFKERKIESGLFLLTGLGEDCKKWKRKKTSRRS